MYELFFNSDSETGETDMYNLQNGCEETWRHYFLNEHDTM